MLVNLSGSKKNDKRMQQRKRRFLQGHYFGSKKHAKQMPEKFNQVFIPYKPCGMEYVADNMDNFTGVYICQSFNAEYAINDLTNTHVLDSLVDYGCVDNASQAIRCFKDRIEHMRSIPELYGETCRGNFVIIMTPHYRDRVYDYKEAIGTFRWHKNGYYSGEADVRCEYFLCEPDEKLKMFYSYTVYRVV